LADPRQAWRAERLGRSSGRHGTGLRKRETRPAPIGIDILDSDAVDVIGDALEVLTTMPAASVHTITSSLPRACGRLRISTPRDRTHPDPRRTLRCFNTALLQPVLLLGLHHVRQLGLLHLAPTCAPRTHCSARCRHAAWCFGGGSTPSGLRLSSDPAFPASSSAKSSAGRGGVTERVDRGHAAGTAGRDVHTRSVAGRGCRRTNRLRAG
jgi:hypothetical protein